MLLFDNAANLLPGRQKERPNRGWDGCGNPGNPFIADDPRATRHLGNQAQRGRSALDGQSCFVDAADAADFYSRGVRRFHEVFSNVCRDAVCRVSSPGGQAGGRFRSLPARLMAVCCFLLIRRREPRCFLPGWHAPETSGPQRASG
jgi:hypothetical protein